MKISIFGASGATGLLLTERCLAAGHQVAALVRSADKFPFRDRVRMLEGSVFDPTPIRRTLDGADVVLSALGARSLKKEDVLEQAVPLIVAIMRQNGIKRIITLGGATAVRDSLRKQPAPVAWLIRTVLYDGILKWPTASQKAQLATLSASGLDWTMVLPPMLTNGPARGTYRVDGEALPPRGMRISRADVADFMVRQIGNPQWVGKAVYIAY